ncbi:unnamed protein product [Chrysodeixis includens]|uniref:snRNA-activating protein complex subunit 4 n=1 Tax=Chrysodeixis includens TaxID=689277 RepID=A0A9P0BXY1_CHRIL|nr:unnamed protein product [Chrysodeixis includens]
MERMEVETDSDDYSTDEELDSLQKLDAVLEVENDESAAKEISVSQIPAQVEPAPPQTLLSQHSTSRYSHRGSKLSAKEIEQLHKIDLALSLNKQSEEKLRKFDELLLNKLAECRRKLKYVQDNSRLLFDRGHEVFRYINCGRPYFKDSEDNTPPDNPDTVVAKRTMYDFSHAFSVPGWTVKDKSQFSAQIQKMSISIRKEEYNSKITSIKRKLKGEKNKKMESQIAFLRKQIDKLPTLPLSELALPIDRDYDWVSLANKLNRRHTAKEYESLWKVFYHPSINKSSWTKNEHVMIKQIALENNLQDWDNVAKQLNTGRTGYQCFVYHCTNTGNTSAGKRWTEEEMTYLTRLIDYFKEDNYIPWGKIAAAMENRTKLQIYNKYLRMIEQRKGRFLPEEDSVILNCAERFGSNYRRMTNYLPGRSMVQIRARHQVLSKMRVSTVWTVDDDRKLIQIMANQDSQMNYSNVTKYFPGRNRINIRSRHITLQKWIKKHPNVDIEHAPRRGARRLNHGHASNNLNSALEGLKDTLNTEVKTSRRKVTKDSLEIDIEDAIVAILVNELVRDMEHSKTQEEIIIDQDNNYAVSSGDLNLTNLRKCLIFLNSQLSKSLYLGSRYKTQYPDLGVNENDVSLVKVKSYSRKNTVKTFKVDETPNIWGKPTLATRTYVMPPHYANITGSRTIMTYASARGNYFDQMNFNMLVKKYPLLKEQLDLLTERFYLLFTWPLVLSNEGPDLETMDLKKLDSSFIRPPNLPQPPEVTINMKCIKKYKNVEVTEIIDLHEESSQDDTTPATDEDSFMLYEE